MHKDSVMTTNVDNDKEQSEVLVGANPRSLIV
jgi:hypothetical protein